MSDRRYAAREAEVPRGTLNRLFFDAVDRYGEEAAFRSFPGAGPTTRDLSYRDAEERARRLALGIRELGIEPGDRIAIYSENRPEWALTDWACLLSGVIPVPVYSTLIPEQMAYLLQNSEARLVFADGNSVDEALEAVRRAETGARVVEFDPGSLDEEVLSWRRLLERGAALDDDPEGFRRRALEDVTPDDTATILYTSGTTGTPKGVVLTHDNLHSNVWACSKVLDIGPDDTTLSFLPLSHVLQRMVDFLLFWEGCTIAYAHSIETVAEDLKIVQPTLVVSVPRLYEKVYAKVTEVEGLKRTIVTWARGVADRWADAKLAGREPPLAVRLQYALADRLVFRKIREGVGGRLRFFVSGGAPLSAEINRFFYSAGVLILEGYGLTETSPVTNVNPMDDMRIGTVGPPVPGTEIRIADDGEILVRGPQVMKEYYRLPDETAAAIDEEGWFRTGDIGELDEDGYLSITDRKKDIIVTAGGKNIAPQPVENRLKSLRFVDQVVMIGDKRKFPAVLVVPDFEVLESWAKENGIPATDRRSLLENPELQRTVFREIVEHLGPVSGYEKPKKVALLSSPFTIEDGTLTPTQKVRRRVVQERFDTLIDRFYLDENVERDVLVEELE